MAKTFIHLQENELTGLGELEKACDAAVQKFNDLSGQSEAASRSCSDDLLSLRVTAAAGGGLKNRAQVRPVLQGLGAVCHQQARAGIDRRIACRYRELAAENHCLTTAGGFD